MAIITEEQIQSELANGGDWFEAKARIEQRLQAAERAVAQTQTLAGSADNESWAATPNDAVVRDRMKMYGMTYADAFESVKEELAADARRLELFSAESAKEVSEAFAKAQAEKEKAESILAQHEASLESLKSGIISIAHLRRQIRVANLLLIDAAGQRQIAQTAIGYFVQTRGGNTSPQAQGGWDSFAHDLCFRTALNGHVADFVKPLQNEVSELLKSIREQAKTSKIDLRKVVSIMEAERGRQPGASIPPDADLEGIF